jgi:hypothetical protein
MTSLNTITHSNAMLKAFLFGILLGMSLVFWGWLLLPDTNPLGIAAMCLILIVYGLVGYFIFPRIDPEILNLIAVFGLLAGLVFAGEILLEYVLLPKDNTNWGLIEFGSAFALYFLCGLWVAFRYRSIHDGTLAAILSAMLSSLIWLIFLLLSFYIFRGTIRQQSVFSAEGNYADFTRSGMSDFNTFVMEDFLGAGFFHLLLAPLFAAVLGAIGSVLGKGLIQLSKH